MGADSKHFLFIDDSAEYRKLLRHRLGKLFPAAEITEYDPIANGRPPQDFNWEGYDLLILDHDLGQGETGLDWFMTFKECSHFPTTIMLTGVGNEELAVQAIKSGIYNYLDKLTASDKHLYKVIFEALEFQNHEDIKERYATLQGGIFNKSLFYSRLEETLQNQQEAVERALLLIKIDNFTSLVETGGLIVSDNLIRHIARVSYEAFSGDNLHPNITRFADHSVVLLVDTPAAEEEITSSLQRLCDYIGERPFNKDGKALDYSVSIGLVHLQHAPQNANIIFTLANKASEKAGQEAGNSFYYYLYSATEKEETAEGSQETKARDDKEPVGEKRQLQGVAAAIDENRLFLKFCPIAKLSNFAEQQPAEYYDISVGMVKLDGTSIEGEEFSNAVENDGAGVQVDRWILRNCMGKLAEAAQYNQLISVVFIPVSLDTLQDKTFFDWLRELLKDEAQPHSKNVVVLEISCHDVFKLKKLIKALVEYLSKVHRFLFLISDVADVSVLTECQDYININFIKFSDGLNQELIKTDNQGQEGIVNIINHSKQIKALTIARNINDAAELSRVIMGGVDLASGKFIGVPVDEVWETSLIESMDITGTHFRPWEKREQ